MKTALLPFVAWVVAGSCKFAINYLRFGKRAQEMIGYGGFPSTHTTVLSSVVFYTGLTYGFDSAIFTLALGSLVILIIDAHGLRKKVGDQARAINKICDKLGIEDLPRLRESMGHSWAEICGGLVLGLLLAWSWRML